MRFRDKRQPAEIPEQCDVRNYEYSYEIKEGIIREREVR